MQSPVALECRDRLFYLGTDVGQVFEVFHCVSLRHSIGGIISEIIRILVIGYSNIQYIYLYCF